MNVVWIEPCPTPCDADCAAECHEAHLPRWKRSHDCESHRTALVDSQGNGVYVGGFDTGDTMTGDRFSDVRRAERDVHWRPLRRPVRAVLQAQAAVSRGTAAQKVRLNVKYPRE